MQRSRTSPGFILFELIGCLAITAMLFLAFTAGMHRLHQTETELLERNRAHLVLENVLERAGAEARVTPALLDSLLQFELSRSPLHRADRYEARSTGVDGRVRLHVRKVDGPVLSAVEVGP